MRHQTFTMLQDNLEFKTNKMNLFKKGIALLILVCIPKTMQATDHVDPTNLLIKEILKDDVALDYFATLQVQNFHKTLNVIYIGETEVQAANNQIIALTAQFNESGNIKYKNKIAQILGYESDALYQKTLAVVRLKKSKFTQKYGTRISNLENKEVFTTELTTALRGVSNKFTRCFDDRIKYLLACLGIVPSAAIEFKYCFGATSLASTELTMMAAITGATAAPEAAPEIIDAAVAAETPVVTWNARMCAWLGTGAFGSKAIATDCVKGFLGILTYCIF